VHFIDRCFVRCFILNVLSGPHRMNVVGFYCVHFIVTSCSRQCVDNVGQEILAAMCACVLLPTALAMESSRWWILHSVRLSFLWSITVAVVFQVSVCCYCCCLQRDCCGVQQLFSLVLCDSYSLVTSICA